MEGYLGGRLGAPIAEDPWQVVRVLSMGFASGSCVGAGGLILTPFLVILRSPGFVWFSRVEFY